MLTASNMHSTNQKKYYEFRLSLIQILLSLCALFGCFFFAFTLGAFMGSRFLQSFSLPPAAPPPQSVVAGHPVSDYRSFETLSQPSADAEQAAPNLSFFEMLPQKVDMPPPPAKEVTKSAAAMPAEPPAKPVAAERPSATPLKEGAYTIQVAAFLQAEKAHALADTFISHGHPAQVVSKTDQKGATWHRVRVGNFKTLEEAKRLLPQLTQLAAQPHITPAE